MPVSPRSNASILRSVSVIAPSRMPSAMATRAISSPIAAWKRGSLSRPLARAIAVAMPARKRSFMVERVQAWIEV